MASKLYSSSFICTFLALLFIWCFFSNTSANASDLPSQDKIFTIYNFNSPGDKGENHASEDLIFSALPLYQKLPPNVEPRWTKDGFNQQGVIVLKDKTVLYFETESSLEITTIDSDNHFVAYRMPYKPTHLQKCPKYDSSYDQMPFPKPDDVFCIAQRPWIHWQAFTSNALIQALPYLRPTTIYPPDWVQASRVGNGQAGGVMVFKNYAVLEFFSWSSSAITFENYKSQEYFMTK